MNVSKVEINTRQNIISNNKTRSPKFVTFGEHENKDEIEISKKDEITDNIENPIEDTSKKASTAKKWGVGLASFFTPGAGQFVNNEVNKGFAMLIPAIALFILSKLSKGGVTWILSLAGLGLAIFSTVDAVKNVKPDQE